MHACRSRDLPSCSPRKVTAKLGTIGMLMHCFGAATALTLVHYLDFWGQLAAITNYADEQALAALEVAHALLRLVRGA